MKKIDTIKDKIFIVLAVYTIGLLLGLILYFLRFLNWVYAGWGIKVQHWERFPKKQKRVLVVANHPSLLEPILIPVLFFRDYIFHPFDAPWSVPDKKNYFDRWYWAWVKIRLIPVDRENRKRAADALKKIIRILQLGDKCILFVEGGRTFKGKEFIESKEGKKLRRLKAGIASVVLEVDPLIVPIWIDNAENVLPNDPNKLYHCLPRFWKSLTVKIGKPFHVQSISRKKTIKKIAEALLELADEE